jgi:hypothetical protein
MAAREGGHFSFGLTPLTKTTLGIMAGICYNAVSLFLEISQVIRENV